MYSSSVHDMPAQLQVGTVFTEGLKPERDASHPPPQISVWRGLLPRQPQSFCSRLHHEDPASLTLSFSMSLMEWAPESMGEETVQSISEGGAASAESETTAEVGRESKEREAGES